MQHAQPRPCQGFLGLPNSSFLRLLILNRSLDSCAAMVTVEEASIVSPPETSAKGIASDRDGGGSPSRPANGLHTDTAVCFNTLTLIEMQCRMRSSTHASVSQREGRLEGLDVQLRPCVPVLGLLNGNQQCRPDTIVPRPGAR